MNPDVTYVDYILALIGGIILGVSTTLHVYYKGKVTGMSGIVFSCWSYNNKCFTPNTIDDEKGLNIYQNINLIERQKENLATKNSWYYNLMLFLSLVFAGSVCFLVTESIKSTDINNTKTLFYQHPVEMITGLSLVGFAIGGFLVGFGTKLGNGCTSGHGVCGLPRFSLRSFIAVCSFFSFALLTANTKQYVFKWAMITEPVYVDNNLNYQIFSIIFLIVSLFLFILVAFLYYNASRTLELTKEFNRKLFIQCIK